MPNTDSRFLAILTVRNEGAFLIDWIAHHRAVGFTDFLVLSNDCTDGTDAMLDRLDEMGWITHMRNEGPFRQGPQWAALRRAGRHPLREAADWTLFFDIDEFVNIRIGDGTLPALIAALPQATAIPLTWRLYGNDGVVAFEDRPVTETFVRAAPRVMGWPWRASMFKTLFREDGSYAALGVHRPRQPDPERLKAQRWFDGSGRELPALYRTDRIFSPFGQDNYALVQLNHYALGSMESYIVKRDRGRANRTEAPADMAYWVERNLCVEDDPSIARMAARSAPLREKLRADPVLGPLHRDAVAWRHQRFDELMAEEPYRALFARLLMTPPSRPLTTEETRFLIAHAQRSAATETEVED